MEAILNQLMTELSAISHAVNTVMPEDRAVSVALGNWQFPSVSRVDLSNKATGLAKRVQERGEYVSAEAVKQFPLHIEKLVFLRTHTIPNLWGSPHVAIPAYMITLDALSAALDTVLPNEIPVQEISEAIAGTKRARQRLRGLISELDHVEPKTKELSHMVARIEQAQMTADQLPTDLSDLRAKREEMDSLVDQSRKDIAHILEQREQAVKNSAEWDSLLAEAKAVLNQCERAYAASTSVGLAAAFSERSQSLAWSMRAWVIGLFGALAAGGYMASLRIKELEELVTLPQVSSSGIAFSLVLAASSVGGAIWFAWVATKQIGQRFRLSEDYAFKASISRAYEGYRKEASRIDPGLEVSLLRSALQRLDELPLRLVESDSHATPLTELLGSILKNKAEEKKDAN